MLNKKNIISTIFSLSSMIFAINATAAQTPSEVFMQTQRAIAEVTLIRTSKGNKADYKKVGVQKKKRPLHVYGKCIEVVEKIARLQKKEGVSVSKIPSLPMRNITPSEVYQCTQTMIDGLRTVKSSLGITSTIEEPSQAVKKTPSHVYRNMWQLSYLLDTLVAQTSPNEVYRNTQVMMTELEAIAKNKAVSLSAIVPIEAKNKTPKHVLLSCLKGLNNLKKVQKKLKAPALSVPKMPAGKKILPSDVYDCTNTQLTELHALKIKIGITKPKNRLATPTGKTPSDVYVLMAHYSAQLKQLHASL
jgi:hypothetical protein